MGASYFCFVEGHLKASLCVLTLNEQTHCMSDFWFS